MRTPRLFSWFSVLLLVAASGCGSGGEQSSGSGGSSSSSGSGAGGAQGSSSSQGSGGAGGMAASSSSSASGSSGAGGASSSSASASASSSSASASASSSSASSSATSSSSGGLPPGSLGAPCTWPQACNAGLYCDAPGCGMGKCAQKPGIAMVPNTQALVCGCDNVTYWNQENAAYHGAAIASQGAPCPAAASLACGPGMPCPSGFSCNHKVNTQALCAAPGLGVCWSMPVSCPLGGPSAKACSNNQCATQCALIQSENPWWNDGLCP